MILSKRLKGYVCDVARLIERDMVTPEIWEHLEAMRLDLENRSLDDTQLHLLGGILAMLGLITQQHCAYTEAESRLTPRQLFLHKLAGNAIVTALRKMYPLPEKGHITPIVAVDCMDSRRNTKGLGLFMDSRHIIDSVSGPGSVLTPDVINGIEGAVNLHDSSLILLIRHTTCGLGGVAAHPNASAARGARQAVMAYRSFPEYIGWLLEKPGIYERAKSGKLWVVVAQADTATGELFDLHKCELVDDKGVCYSRLTVDDDGDLVEGKPTFSSPQFLTPPDPATCCTSH